MKSDIILAGVGGQGILSIAAVIGMAALENELYLKQAEVHGMSQRGGAVQSHLRISDKPIASDLIPYGRADLILSIEPMEALRYVPYLCKDGWIVSNSEAFVNISGYPDIKSIHEEIGKIENHILINADKFARDAGSPRSSNMVMLGAASAFTGIPESNIHKGIIAIFEQKGKELVDLNIKAFQAGRNAADKYRNS